jgi:hypothetical protein
MTLPVQNTIPVEKAAGFFDRASLMRTPLQTITPRKVSAFGTADGCGEPKIMSGILPVLPLTNKGSTSG